MRPWLFICVISIWSNAALAIETAFPVLAIKNTWNTYDFVRPSKEFPVGIKEGQINTEAMIFAAKHNTDTFDFYLCPVGAFSPENCAKVNNSLVDIRGVEHLVLNGIGPRPNDLLGSYSDWGNSLPTTRGFVRQNGEEFLRILKSNGASAPLGPIQTWTENGYKIFISQIVYYSGAQPNKLR